MESRTQEQPEPATHAKLADPAPVMPAPLSTTGRSGDDGLPNGATIQTPGQTNAFWSALRSLGDIIRRYPLPVGALALLVVSGGLWLAGRDDLARYPLIIIGVVGIAPLLWDTVRQLLRREFGVDLLALLAIGGSLLLGQYLAGAIIVLMLAGGEALEAFALRRARSSLASLAERAPRTAHILRGADVITIPAEAVTPGMEVLVKPGEIVPVDGVVTRGSTSVSEADLTGEPTPVRKEAGALTLSGSVNLDSVFYVRATKPSAESQYAQIVRLVEEAQQRKAPIHRLADQYAVWFTLLALVIAGLAWVFSGDSMYALAVLVVATPCPLILATPIAIMSGVDAAAHKGVIVKSGAVIEQLSLVDAAVFDKTGTLTLGRPELIEILPVGTAGEDDGASAVGQGGSPAYSADTLLQFAASVEQFSPHILARAVVEAARERGMTFTLATDVEDVAGKGTNGRVPIGRPSALASASSAEPDHDAVASIWASPDGPPVTTEEQRAGAYVAVAIGNRTFMRRLEIPLSETLLATREQLTREGRMASFLAVEGRVVGLLVFADRPRPELAQLVPALKAVGVQQTALLTGDGPVVAQQVGKLAGVDRVVAQCLPEEKVRVVRELEQQGHHTLMVGDGVNDAPALASATVGLAMGAQGLTAASSAADAVLLATDVLQVAAIVRLGKQVVRVARQGIWIGIGLSVVAMVVAAVGLLTPTMGAILQEGIDVLVILNALRAGRTG